MGKENRFSRREFLVRSALTAAEGFLVFNGISNGNKKTKPPIPSSQPVSVPTPVYSSTQETQQVPEKEKEKTFHDILGVHDTPDTRGNINTDLAVQDINTLGAKFLTTLNPQKLTKLESNVTLIARDYSRDNRFKKHRLKNILEIMENNQKAPLLIVPFNEPNLRRETDEEYRSPEDHVKDLLNAADLISGKGGITLITPLSQNAIAYEDDLPVDEFDYFRRMLIELSRHVSASDLLKYAALGVHAYAMHPGEDIRPRLYKLDGIVKEIFGIGLPMYITEGGLYQDRKTNYPPELVKRETRRLIETPIGDRLDIRSYILWLLSNKAQRPADTTQNATFMDDFEAAALRTIFGVTPTYKMLEELAKE